MSGKLRWLLLKSSLDEVEGAGLLKQEPLKYPLEFPPDRDSSREPIKYVRVDHAYLQGLPSFLNP